MRMQDKYHQVVRTKTGEAFIAGCIACVILNKAGQWLGRWKNRRVRMVRLGVWQEV